MGWSRSDDLNGTTPAEEVLFGFDGTMYAIDLGTTSFEKMQAALQPFLTVARVYGDMPLPEEMDPQLVESSPPPTPAPRVVALKTRKGTKATKGGATRKVGARSAERQLAEKAGVVKPDFGTIRTWANENGYTVGPTGRIPKAIMDAYDTQTPNL